MKLRFATVVIAVAATCLAAAPVSPAAVRLVHRGQLVTLGHSFPLTSQMACTASVTYADGFAQHPVSKTVTAGHVSWTIRIPRRAVFGPAGWLIRCGVVWQLSGTWRVVPA